MNILLGKLLMLCILVTISLDTIGQKPLKYFIHKKKFALMANYVLKIPVENRFFIEPLAGKHNVRIYANNEAKEINFQDQTIVGYLDSIGLKLYQIEKLSKWIRKTHTHGIEVRNFQNAKYCKIVFGGHFFIESVKGLVYTDNIEAFNTTSKHTWKQFDHRSGLTIYYYKYSSDLSY